MARELVVWVADDRDSDAMGRLPPEVTLTGEPRPDVRVAVPEHGGAWPDFAALPALEVVQVLAAGVDWIVDAVPDGVTLCSARGARDAPVAEWIVAALLADAKHLTPFARARQWSQEPIGDLAGRRVLILGHGSIGQATAQRLAPFGCEVVGVARHARPGVHALDDLDALLPTADALVNLLPLTPQTQRLVGAGVLGGLPDGALVVSAGRGGTVDQAALTAELAVGRLRAVLDVTDPEPLPEDDPLWSLPNVLITSHTAGATEGGRRAAWALVGDQLRRLVAGEPLHNIVA